MVAHSTKAQRSSWRANHINNMLRLAGLLILIALATIVYHVVLHDVLKTKDHFFTYFVVAWVILSYLILPRVYRLFSKVFIPNYFIGRTQAADGILGDPINLAIFGDREDIIHAMEAAGWKQADKVTLKSSLKIIYTTILSSPYPTAPVSPLFLFDNKQDLAFEKSVGDNPRKRHHARFWNIPDDYWLPGGYRAHWLGAATFDRNVGLSLFTGQVTHKIDGDVDHERDFVVNGIKKNVEKVKWVEHFTSSYYSRNGGGDTIHTDGSMPFIHLKPAKK
jgi:hypothetical protein